MSISLNNVNSEVVRAHKRIDDIVLGNGVTPKYDKGESLKWNTKQTITKTGIVDIYWYGANNQNIAIRINDINLDYKTRDGAAGRVIYPVKTGDTIYCSGGYDSQRIKLYPYY